MGAFGAHLRKYLMAAKVALYDRILDRHGSPGVLGCGAERLLVTKGNVRRGSATRSSVMSAPNSPRLPTMSSPYALAAITALPVRDSSCRHRSIRGDKVLRKFHTQPTTCSDGVLGLHILQRNALVDNAGDQERHCPHSPGSRGVSKALRKLGGEYSVKSRADIV